MKKLKSNKTKKNGIIITKNATHTNRMYYNNGKQFFGYSFPSVNFLFNNKMLNDENLFYMLLSEKMGLEKYFNIMIERLQQGLVPLVVLESLSEEKCYEISQKVDNNTFKTVMVYNEYGAFHEIWITPHGLIGELFDLDSIEKDFSSVGKIVNLKQYQNIHFYDYFSLSIDDNLNNMASIRCLKNLFYGLPYEFNIIDTVKHNYKNDRIKHCTFQILKNRL